MEESAGRLYSTEGDCTPTPSQQAQAFCIGSSSLLISHLSPSASTRRARGNSDRCRGARSPGDRVSTRARRAALDRSRADAGNFLLETRPRLALSVLLL